MSERRYPSEVILSVIEARLDNHRPAEALGSAGALAALAADVRGAYSDADWLRERFAANKSLAHTVRESAARWAGDKPRASG